jgi:hypothetical protein
MPSVPGPLGRSALVPLLGLPEYGQEHDRPPRSTPVRDPGRNIAQPDPKLPDRSLRVIGPWATQFGALFGEHAAYFVDPLEVAVAEAVQSVADLRFELEVVEAPYPAVHAWSGYRSSGPKRPYRSMVLTGLSGHGARSERSAAARALAVGFNGLGVVCLRDSRSVTASGLEHSDVSVANEKPGLTGSQPPRTACYARPRPAILAAAGPHVRP